MNRRQALKGVLAGALTLSAGDEVGQLLAQTPEAVLQPTNAMVPTPANRPAPKLRGVNLGSWLILERWMVPSVYRGTNAQDEYTLCQDLGARAAARLDQHRKTFITADDFAWIKAHGLDAVRLPIGYWALDAPVPYVEASHYVDFAFDQAQKNGLKLLLDLHGAPGSQNGMDHSGRSGPIGWTTPENVEKTIVVLEALAKRYGKHPALYGIELLNEPRWDVSIDILKSFYQAAYQRIRPLLPAQAAVVIHDGFRPFAWKNFMTEPDYSNVVLDTHPYQAYTDADKKRTPQEHVAFALDRKKTLDAMAQQLWVLVGEWSLATPDEVLRGLSPFEAEMTKRAYGAAQLLSYETTRGWFYWSYKLEYNSDWNFRYCVEQGLLPASFMA